MKGSAFLYAYTLITVLITSTSFGAHQYGVGCLALGLGMIGIFVYKNQNHSAVREWLERYF